MNVTYQKNHSLLGSSNIINDTINDQKKATTPMQTDNPCNSSHVPLVSASKDCEILLKSESDLSAEQKLEIILNFFKYNPAATYRLPTNLGKTVHFNINTCWLGYPIIGYGIVIK